MHCSKTGKRVVFPVNHVYAGDEFQCKGCGAKVVVTNLTPYPDPQATTYDPNDPTTFVDMTPQN